MNNSWTKFAGRDVVPVQGTVSDPDKIPCGNFDCSVSTGLHDGLTFGSGRLDFNGFWSEPCPHCARDHERRHPEDGECWPFTDSDIEAIKKAAAEELAKPDERWPGLTDEIPDHW